MRWHKNFRSLKMQALETEFWTKYFSFILAEWGFESDPENGTFGREELFWESEASHSNGLPIKCETSTSCPSTSDVPSTDCYKNVAQPQLVTPCLHSNNYNTIMKSVKRTEERIDIWMTVNVVQWKKYLWKGILYFPKMYPINNKQKNVVFLNLKPNLNISK